MPWSTAEYEQLSLQFNNLASIPNFPGSYIIGRYTQFAFLAAYDDLANPTDEMLKYINTINKEITRKRDEFDLETLEVGTTLADKRIGEIKTAISELDDSAKKTYKAEIAQVNAALAKITKTSAFVPDADIALFTAAAQSLRKTQYSEFYEIAEMLDQVAECLTKYQAAY